MEVKNASDDGRPIPEPDETTRPFWEAAARGELRIQRCPACEHRQFYPRALCIECGATPEWQTASGRGVVHTFTIIRQYGAEPFRSELPYVVAIIELDEGVQMMGNVTGCDPESVAIGMPVEAWALRPEDDIGIVQWRATGPA